ncbi:MAG TPA: hypothetical protein VJO35_10240 [Terriglobales bacterium]|nr:hypothetical protein [Terriglobales bacterium]
MNSELNNRYETSPVSQGTPESVQMDVWEPPFERWLRIADSLLSKGPISYYSIVPRPQKLAPVHRG